MIGIARFNPLSLDKVKWVIELYGPGDKDKEAVKITQCFTDGWDEGIQEGDIVESCVRKVVINNEDDFIKKQNKFKTDMAEKSSLPEHEQLPEHNNLSEIDKLWVEIGRSIKKRNEGNDDYKKYNIGNAMNKIESLERQ